MFTTASRYFHVASLRQRYIDELDQATQFLQVEERSWLHTLTRPPVAGQADPVRVDGLTGGADSAPPFELAAALLLSHGQTQDPRVYLFTLSRGIERFSNRTALLNTLRARFAAGDPNALFEAETIEGDPFRAQMLAIVDHQVAQIRQITEQLSLTPSLLQAATASLLDHMRVTMPHIAVDPATHLLQVVPTSINDDSLIPTTQTLTEAAFDDCCNVQLDHGFERRFLDAHGQQASAEDATLFAKVLSDAKATLAEQYRKLLNAFWSAAGQGQRTRRELAIERFGDNLRGAFHAHRHRADLGRIHLQMLQAITADLRMTPAPHCKRLTIKVGESASCPLAGTFVMQLENDPSLLWFTPDQKLVSFDDVQGMTAYFATPQGRERLRPALALEDQSSMAQEGQLQIDLQQILAPVCADRVDSIIAAQIRNLQYALTLPRTPEAAAAMIDDALDVRPLLDPLQLSIPAGRWRRAEPFNFADVWVKSAGGASGAGAAPVSTGMKTLGTENASTSDPGHPPRAWRQRTLNFDKRAERLRGLDAVFLDSAEQALQPYMWMLTSDTVRAKNVHVQWLESASVDVSHVQTYAVAVSESQRLVSVDLVSLLIECVSEFRTLVLPASARVVVDSVSARHPAIDLVCHMLTQEAPVFLKQYLRRFEQFRMGSWRQGDRQIRPGREEIALRMDAMRLDLMLAWREAWVGRPALDMVRQVLEQPLRSMRLMLDRPITEVCSVWLTFSGHSILLCDTLLFREPADSRKPIMLWSAVAGWRQVESLGLLQDIFEDLLRGPQSERWQGLVSEQDRQLLRTYLSQPLHQLRLRLEPVAGHAFEALQRDVLNRDQQNLRQLCLRAKRWRFEANLFCRLAQDTELDTSLFNMLDELSLRVENCLFEALLPAWLTSAAVEDLKAYLEHMTRYYLVSVSDGGKTFLFGIPPLRVYAREKLIEQLSRDFPQLGLDPDRVTVTTRRYVSAFPTPGELPSSVPAATVEHHESLTEYAINRFVNQQDAVLSVQFADQEHGTQLLTPDSLRRLVRSLDVGASYLALLRKALAPEGPDYAERKRLFINQLPPIFLSIGIQEKLKGHLSALAYAYISRIFDMPDGVAREPLDGVRVMISPLQLVADAGMTPDPVSGVYVIGTAIGDAGPVVLMAIHHSDFTFREFVSQNALLQAIRSDQSLQALLLERLDPEVHRRYAHGGFVEPHLPFSVGLGEIPLRAPGPVTLDFAEVRGNALQYLFKGVLRLLLDQSVSNVVTNLQFDQTGRRLLATLGFEQLFSLLPNKLATLVTLWQSESLLRASVASVSGRRWGEALSEFSAALGVMVSAREQALEDQGVGSVVAEGEYHTTTTSTWGGYSLNLEQRVRLQGLEAQSVALEQMRRDDLLNLYLDGTDNTPYAVVDGRVYQVRQTGDDGRWSIVGADGAPGPQLVLDTDQRWHLDLSLRLRGGGGRAGKVRPEDVDLTASDSLIIQASGMHEIRLRYRDRARRIVQAHLKARLYLENALDNLNVNGRETALDPRVAQVISDFFGMDAPDRPLLDRIKGTLKTLFDAVMEPSLAPFSSPRFVVGSNRPGHDTVTAFVIKGDPKQRLFLTEHFFLNSQYALSPQARAQGFESSIHHRAAILLHELSHQILDTYDIAYLECMAPYPDLLLEHNAESVRLKALVERLHDYRLSHRTEAAILFKVEENGAWRDLTPKDDRGVKRILQITQTTNLDDARHVFLNDADKRSRVMLTNADSLVLLILRLGRHNYVATNP